MLVTKTLQERASMEPRFFNRGNVAFAADAPWNIMPQWSLDFSIEEI